MDKLALVINFAKEIYFDSSDCDSEILEKVENFAEVTVPLMNDKQFQIHFRMNPITFKDMLRKVQSIYKFQVKGMPRVNVEKELLITIWYLSNMESFRSVADRFGISKSVCWTVLSRTCILIQRVNQHFKIISWPSRERQQFISEAFQVNGLHGIIGCIDGSHIPIIAPKEYHTSYLNRKKFHSVLLQGVCDNRMLFLDVYAGEPGSIHDYTLYNKSDLCTRIATGEAPFHDNNYIVGDLAYKLDIHLMVGFKRYQNLTNQQKHFNKCLSKARCKIENAYAYLKGRFRKLKYLETRRLDIIALLIVSACVLHNICILNGDMLEGLIDIATELNEINDNPQNEVRDIEDEEERQLAIEKRNNLVIECNNLMQ